MLFILRKLRNKMLQKNKSTSYFLYAFGEIFLVVIGILIALGINNWNEGRINRQKEALLVKNIIEDLHIDAQNLDKALRELQDQMNVVDDLIAKAMDNDKTLDYTYMGLVRYSSDFRPVTQRNHADIVSQLENDVTRNLLLNYFIKEDQVLDIFKEYWSIIHNVLRPYLRETGMHNLNSLYTREGAIKIEMLLIPEVLDDALTQVAFQQMLFERRLKTESFGRFMRELKVENQELVKSLSTNQ